MGRDNALNILISEFSTVRGPKHNSWHTHSRCLLDGLEGGVEIGCSTHIYQCFLFARYMFGAGDAKMNNTSKIP